MVFFLDALGARRGQRVVQLSSGGRRRCSGCCRARRHPAFRDTAPAPARSAARAGPGARPRRSATRRSSRGVWTFSCRFSDDVFVRIRVDGAGRKHRVGPVVGDTSTSWLPRTCATSTRPIKRSGQIARPTSSADGGSTGGAERGGDQPVRPHHVELDRRDAARQLRRLRPLAVEFGDLVQIELFPRRAAPGRGRA